MLQHTLKKYAKFGTKSMHFEKKNQSALISAILKHFEQIRKVIFHDSLYFLLFTISREKIIIRYKNESVSLNILSPILLTVRFYEVILLG